MQQLENERLEQYKDIVLLTIVTMVGKPRRKGFKREAMDGVKCHQESKEHVHGKEGPLDLWLGGRP